MNTKERITAIGFRVNEHERTILEELTWRDGRRSVSEYLRELIRKEASVLINDDAKETNDEQN